MKKITTLLLCSLWFVFTFGAAGASARQPAPSQLPPVSPDTQFPTLSFLGRFDPPAVAFHQVQVVDDTLYASDGKTLYILDVQDPSVPIELGHISIAESNSKSGTFEVYGNTVYVGGFYILKAIDVSDPTHPVVIGSYPFIDEVFDIEIKDQVAFVSVFSQGIYTFDIQDPGNFVLLDQYGGFTTTGRLSVDIKVRGRYAYVSGAEITAYDHGVVEILDVQDPKDIHAVGHYDYMGGYSSCREMDFVRSTGLFHCSSSTKIGNEWHGVLETVDVRNPSQPVLIDWYPYSLIDLQAIDDWIYLITFDYATKTGEIGLFQLDEQGELTQWMMYDPDWLPVDLWTSGNLVYVATAEDGLQIFRLLKDEVAASIPQEGGALTSTNGHLQLAFPSGAFPGPANLTYQGWFFDENIALRSGIGETFELAAVSTDTSLPLDLSPGQAYTLTLDYSAMDLGSVVEDTLAFYYWDGDEWIREPTSRLDKSSQTLAAKPGRLSRWAVLGEARLTFLPILNHSKEE